MEMGIIGLGRMGGNMAVRLLQRGHTVVGEDPKPLDGVSRRRDSSAGGADRRVCAGTDRATEAIAQSGLGHGSRRQDHRLKVIDEVVRRFAAGRHHH